MRPEAAAPTEHPGGSPLQNLVGASSTIVALRERIGEFLRRQVGASRRPSVLIQGETGTGKGLLARILHEAGPRATGPFVDVNCAAIPETLLEAELFGYERGAFTDARRAKPGLLQTAHGGTFFLDEIGLLPPGLQSKLLTVLESGMVRRLGASHADRVSVWLIAATNADLSVAIRDGRFRADLYHRLAVVTFTLPALRERGSDIDLLAERSLIQVCRDYGLPQKSLGARARSALRAHAWPGNVRELNNVIERAALLSDSAVIDAAALQLAEAPPGSRAGPVVLDAPSPGAAARAQLIEALARTDWNISRTAALLGLTRNTVRSRIERFGLRSSAGGAESAPPTEAETAPAEMPPAARPPAENLPAARPARAPAARPSGGESAWPRVALRWDRRRIALLRVVLGDAGGGEGAALPWSRGIEIIVDKVRSLGGTLDGISPHSAEASFGVDPIEEPTTRAAHAALAIRRELRTARLHPPGGEFRIGIHAGEVLVARAGGAAQIDAQSRREIAPRLEALIAAADPESIVVDAATAAFLRRRFVLAPAGRPGSDPALYRVVRHEPLALDGTGKIAPFVGRRQELAILQDRLQAALAGRGQVVAVLGHPGVGKSRLVWEFTRSADVRPARLLVTGCADASKTPYQPVIELVRRYAGLGFDDDAQVILERLGRALASAPDDLASSLPALLALFDIRSDEWDALDPVERRHRTLSAAKQLLLAESRVHPLVVVVDDMHWIDSESQAFLDALVEGLPTAPVMLVVTYRPEGRHAWGHLSYYSQLHVDSLPRASALQLLENLLGTDPSLEPVAQHVVARTDGNPLFLEESIQALIETGVLEGERGAYRATRSALPGQVPATIEAILATRIERLGPGDKALVQSAAAIGAEVPIGVLSAIVDLAPEALREEVRRLQAAELLYEGSSPMGNGFVFKHALTREVAYGSLQPDERRALHRRILAAMGAMARDSALESIDRLAHHAFQGELWTEAVAYLKQAGDRAMGAAAVREAAQYFAQALEALGHLPESQRVLEDVVDLRLRRRDALWTSLELDALRENLREAERIAEHLHDQTRGGWVACYHCHYFWAVGDLARALPAGQRALDIAVTVNNPALRAESSFYCGLVQQAAGDFRQSVASLSQTLHALERAISIANPEFPSRRFALTGPVILRSFLVRALAQLGEFREALACGADAMTLADASGNPFALVAARGGVGNAHVRKGEPAQAIQVLEPGLRVCRAYGLRQWLPTLGGALGLAYVQTGRIDEGLALLQECVECGSSLGLLASASAWEINLGEAYLRAGRRGEARSVAHRVLAACRTRRERGYEAWALVLLAEVEATGDEPDLDSARARYEEAIALGTERGMRPLLAHCQRGLGQLAARRGQPREAGERLGRAAAAFREIDMTWPGE